MKLSPAREKVVTLKNTRNVYSQAAGTSLCCEQYQLLAFPCHQWLYIPMVSQVEHTLSKVLMMLCMARVILGGLKVSCSFSGWRKSFWSLLFHSDLWYCLLMATSHIRIMLDVVDLARDNDVIPFCLPPHTTHSLQPLTVAVFKSLKSNFCKAVKLVSFSKKNLQYPSEILLKLEKVLLSRPFLYVRSRWGFASMESSLLTLMLSRWVRCFHLPLISQAIQAHLTQPSRSSHRTA